MQTPLTNLIDLVPRGRRSPMGRQHNGPCEICGGGRPAGDDRLIVWANKGAYRDPSGHVWQPIGTFYCRRCGAKGDAIDYLRQARGLSFAAALRCLGIDLDPEAAAEATTARQTAERARAQQEALRLQRLRHAFARADEVTRADLLADDPARRLHDLETRHLETSLYGAFEAIEAVLTPEQKVRTATARAVLQKGLHEMSERVRLNHIHPITASGL